MAAGLSQPRLHTCLSVISRYPSSCPSALGLFRFRLQSATELNLPSETSHPWGGRHQVACHRSAPVATTSQLHFFCPCISLTGNLAPHTALIVCCKSQATLPATPLSWRTLGCFSTHHPIHTQQMKVLAEFGLPIFSRPPSSSHSFFIS